MVFVLLEVVEEETAVDHDRLVLLGDLVRLRQVRVGEVLPVEFDLWQNAATKCERGFDSKVEALLVEDWKHAGQGEINEVSVSVGISVGRVQRSCEKKEDIC